MRTLATLVFLTFVALASCLPVAWAEVTEEKAFGELKPDKALLYVIRPKGPRGANNIEWDIFADQQYLLRLHGNSYGFIYLEPGRYTIWGGLSAKEIEFVPGEAFYLLNGELGTALVSETEGRAYIEQTRYYDPPDARMEEKRAEKEAKAGDLMAKVKRRAEKHGERIEVPIEGPLPETSDTTGRIQVPQYSPVEVELMEAVSSTMSELGEAVWFRARTAASVNGRVWLPEGTPIQGILSETHSASRFGGSAGLELVIPSITAADGTVIPTIGHLIDAGRHRQGAASTASAIGGALGGALGGAMIKGKEAFILCREPWKIWTRHEAWVSSTPSIAATESQELEGNVHQYRVRCAEPLQFNLEKHREIDDIRLIVESDETLTTLELTSVGDWSLQTPCAAKSMDQEDASSFATFDGWSLLRHLPAGSEPIPLRFTGVTATGDRFVARGELNWQEVSPQ